MKLGVRDEAFVDGSLAFLSLRWSEERARRLYRYLKRIERDQIRTGDIFSPHPPAEELDGEYRYAVSAREVTQGYGTSTQIFPVGINQRELNIGIGIWGMRGKGKTTLIYSLLDPLIRAGISVVIFDYKRDYRALLSYYKNIQIFRLEDPRYYQNPLETVPPATVEDIINGFVSNVCNQFQLLQGSLGFHSRELTNFFSIWDDPANNPPSLRQYLAFLDHRNLHGDDNQFRTRFMRVAGGLLARTHGSLDCSKGIPLDRICRPGWVTIIELDSFLSSHAAFLATDHNQKLFNRRKALADRGAEDGPIISVNDECKNLFPVAKERSPEEGIPLLYKLFCEAAEFRIGGSILADQCRSFVSRMVADNLQRHIYFRLGGQELNWIASTQRFTSEQVDCIANLGVGQAIVISEVGMESIIIPDTFAERKQISETQRIQHMKPIYDELMSYVQLPIKIPEKFWTEFRLELAELTERDTAFLKLVHTNPYALASEIYSRSGLHPSSADRMARKMIKEGLLTKTSIPTGKRGGNIVLFRLTPDGLRVTGLKPLSEGRNESIEHHFWKERIMRKLAASGMDCEMEARLSDYCRVDVLVRKAGRIVAAVEVCLSERHVEENILGDFQAGAPKVILACRTRTLMDKIERMVKREVSEELKGNIGFRALAEYLE